MVDLLHLLDKDKTISQIVRLSTLKLGKPSKKKKSGLVLEIFRKGSGPPPLYLEVMELVRHNSVCHKKREKKNNFPKTPKMAIFNINLMKSAKKCQKVPTNPHFPSKIS